MILSGKKFSSKGRIRYGSSMFVDDNREKITDSLRGYTHDSSLKYALLLLILVKLVSGNAVGIILSLFILYVAHTFTVKKLHLQFTEERLFVISEYKYQRMVLLVGYVLIGISAYVSLNLIFPDYTKYFQYSLDIMKSVFDFFRFLPVIFVVYSNLIADYKSSLIRVDSLITFIVYLFYGIQYLKIRYNFLEIHYSHISEQIIKGKREKNPIILPIIVVTAITSQYLLFNGFHLLTSLVFILIYQYISTGDYAQISLFGNYGRSLLHNIHINPSEYYRVTRATASIFGWVHQGNYYSRPFPSNVIPKEVASHYETGLRASTINALKQANNLGLVFSGFTNIFVIILLFRFAIENNQDAVITVLFIGIGLIFISYLAFQIATQFARYQYRIQREESLMIGRNFIGRYVEPNLWIIRGNKLEGTRLQRGVKNRVFRYDKTRGIIISWQSLTINILVILFIIITLLWIQLGGLNLSNLIYIFPFIFNLSLNFLSSKLSTELGFFILLGYVFWVIIYFNYPTYYSRSRPQLFLEMQYPTSIPIILKNFKEHQDASLQFTKCLINSSRPTRRKSKGRPGTFLLRIILESIDLKDESLSNKTLLFKFGPNENIGEKIVLGNYGSIRLLLIDKLRVSGELGFPRLQVKVELDDVTDDLASFSTHDLEINSNNRVLLRIENRMNIVLSVTVETIIH